MPRKNWHSLPEYEALRAMMEGNTTASAAARLGLSQSAVSRSISSLEARLGRTLFERESGRLKPTAAAVDFNARLDPLFEALDNIDGPAKTSGNGLRIIASPAFSGPFLTGNVASFLRANPDQPVSVEIGTSDDVVAGLQESRYDLGLLGVELSRSGTRLIPFRRARAAIALHRDHPLAARDRIAPADLDGQAVIAFTYRHALRTQFDRLMHEAGATPRIVAEVSTSISAVDLAAAAVGLAVVNPFLVPRDAGPALLLRPFRSPITYHVYFAAPENRPLSRAARHFIQHVRLHTPDDAFSETLR